MPVWLDDLDIACVDPNDEQASCVMVLVRRVAVGADTYLQGLMLDWRILRRSLLERVGDLFPTGVKGVSWKRD